jgi:dienelactone hydrolase
LTLTHFNVIIADTQGHQYMKFSFTLLIALFIVSLQGCATAGNQVISNNYYDNKDVSLKVEIHKVNENITNAPTVILLHNCAGIRGNHLASWVQDLNSWGYNAVIIDAFGSRGIRSVCLNTFTFPRLQFSRDAYYVAKWIKSQSWGSGKIAVMGYSFGAGAVLQMVSPNTVKQEFGDVVISAGVAFYPDCPQMGYQPGVVPIQFHLGGKDDISPPQQCIDLARSQWKDKAIIEYYKDALHGFDMPGMNQIVQFQTGSKLVAWSEKDNQTARARTKIFLDEKLK